MNRPGETLLLAQVEDVTTCGRSVAPTGRSASFEYSISARPDPVLEPNPSPTHEICIIRVRRQTLVCVSHIAHLEVGREIPESTVMRLPDRSDLPDDLFRLFRCGGDRGDETEPKVVLCRCSSKSHGEYKISLRSAFSTQHKTRGPRKTQRVREAIIDLYLRPSLTTSSSPSPCPLLPYLCPSPVSNSSHPPSDSHKSP